MTTTKSDTRLSIIITLQSNGKAATYEQLLNALGKGKTDVDVVLIKNTISQKIADELLQKSAYQELLQKQKIAIAGTYAEAFEKAGGATGVVIENIEHVNVQSIISTVNARKKKLSDDTLYFGSFRHKESNNKNGAFNKFSNAVYNSFFRFLTPSNIQDHSSGILVANTRFGAELFSTKLTTAASYIQIAHQASGHQVHTEDLPFAADKNPPSGSLLSLALIPFLSLWLSFKFFVLSAIKEIKLPSTIQPANKGNYPIYRLVFFVLAAGFCLAYPLLSQDYGMTWDEKQHVEYSKIAYNWVTTFGEDTTALAEPTGNADYVRQIFRNYGEHMNLIAMFVSETLGTDLYDTRHFIISLYGLLGIIAIALTVRALTSWRGAIIALLFIGLNPSWLGFSMNNPTDIPFAVGFAVSGYFMVRVLQQMPKPNRRDITWLGIGIGIGIGSRVGAILIIAYFGMFLGIQWLYNCIKNKKGIFSKGVAVYFKTLFSVAALGYLFGIILWPYALSNPIKNVFISFKKSSENAFYANNTELFEGTRMYMLTEAPGYYVVKFLSIGNPLYMLFGIGLTVLLLNWIRRYVNIGYVLMFLFMMVFPVAWAEYTNLNYYNGWRHYLFVLPSMVVLSAISYEFLLHAFKNKIAQFAVFIILGAAFAKPLLWIVKNHPNQYVYFNETVGGINGAYGNYETDYYSNSCRAAAEWIAQQEPNSAVKVGINNEPLTASYYAHRINPKLDIFWLREYEEYKPRWDYMILTSRTYGYNELRNGGFPPKGTVHVIKADDIPLCVVIKRENNFMPDGYEQLQRRSYDSAIVSFQKACAYDPMNEESFRMLGTAYMMNNNFEQAKTALKTSINIFPQNYSAYSVMGQVFYTLQQADSALHYFDLALHYKRNVTEAYFYAGQCMLQKNDFTGAVKYFEGGINNNGNIPEMYYGLGTAYANLANYSDAETAFVNALQGNPNYAQAYYMLAQVFQKTNEPAKAQECMNRYQKLMGGAR